MGNEERLQKRLDRERKIRANAERIAEELTSDLFASNQKLIEESTRLQEQNQQLAHDLEACGATAETLQVRLDFLARSVFPHESEAGQLLSILGGNVAGVADLSKLAKVHGWSLEPSEVEISESAAKLLLAAASRHAGGPIGVTRHGARLLFRLGSGTLQPVATLSQAVAMELGLVHWIVSLVRGQLSAGADGLAFDLPMA